MRTDVVEHRGGGSCGLYSLLRMRESAVVRSTLYITVRQYAARKRTANLWTRVEHDAEVYLTIHGMFLFLFEFNFCTGLSSVKSFNIDVYSLAKLICSFIIITYLHVFFSTFTYFCTRICSIYIQFLGTFSIKRTKRKRETC